MLQLRSVIEETLYRNGKNEWLAKEIFSERGAQESISSQEIARERFSLPKRLSFLRDLKSREHRNIRLKIATSNIIVSSIQTQRRLFSNVFLFILITVYKSHNFTIQCFTQLSFIKNLNLKIVKIWWSSRESFSFVSLFTTLKLKLSIALIIELTVKKTDSKDKSNGREENWRGKAARASITDPPGILFCSLRLQNPFDARIAIFKLTFLAPHKSVNFTVKNRILLQLKRFFV